METLSDLPFRRSFVSVVQRVTLQTRTFAGKNNIGDVMSNSFKSDAAGDANIYFSAMTTADEDLVKFKKMW